MYKAETKIRVRYGETDQMGVVYYGVYAMYYEVGRVESLRQLGLSYRQLEETGILLPVLENFSRYWAPARYDDELTVATTIKEKPGVRIRFDYEIFNQQGAKLNEGHTLLVFVNKETGKPTRPPEIFEALIKNYFA